MALNCMVVDDDKMSRLVIKKFIDKTDSLVLTHDLDNTKEAHDILLGESANDVDIVFLDIEMPGMSGLELVKDLQHAYNVILVTSKKEYAIEAFEDSVADYLVKPVEYERFMKAVNKVKENLEKAKAIAEQEDHIYVKSDGKLFRLSYNNILFVEALADYVIFNTASGKKHIVHHTMKGIEKRLPESIFSRVHRSYIINRDKIEKIEDLQVFIGEKTFSIGASYKESLMDKFNLL
ncbi:two component transcriptional regulator, LytTR family [Ekhidna lutea]|uniref:Two component transcriptional regulator, LytTR family n=1 Tax=Ekhidna lutea TaxID=447679 RepID=A0A239M783_EKHLU|nr:LytTR family DNA-binding domain-containing protein [Ekhidna lutea]SNT38777.1 two component transcriptional regulator, LytTR family [Ekhidna lutea]